MFENAAKLIQADVVLDEGTMSILQSVGFEDCEVAFRRLRDICPAGEGRAELSACLPMLLTALSEAATPDGSLVNFERYVQSVENRAALFGYLSSHPRAVEILIKLFVGSQFLTEILLRSPLFLEELTNHRALAEFKSRPQFIREADEKIATAGSLEEKFDALRRHQQWELLRIGACDSFGLFDLKSVTVQLSLLADGIVQNCLNLLAAELDLPAEEFCVLAFGKLGGEELNYSSDIDLVFLADVDAERFWRLGQRLIKTLRDSTGEGFFYRVDMRLRPWGRSGALVNTVDAHLDYLKKHGQAWEKQALLKARVIAGDRKVGQEFLQRVKPLIFSTSPQKVRETIREMKAEIETGLKKQGRKWGEIKSGKGSIRDVEFVTQSLQLIHGKACPDVCSFNTMDGLVRLADFGFLHADEYRYLTSGYVFLRTIEHALQLMHDSQTHSLPASQRELNYLARRLDFPNAEEFLHFYERHCRAIRAVFRKYIAEKPASLAKFTGNISADGPADHGFRMVPSYSETFTEEELSRHTELLQELSSEKHFELEAVPADGGLWVLTIVGENHPGELSLICGMLFVYGYDILDGNVFTAEVKIDQQSNGHQQFIDVFTLRPPEEILPDDVWSHFRENLHELVQSVRDGRVNEAHGRLAKRVAAAMRESTDELTTLYPVEIEIDNAASPDATVLQIRSEDTIGFLYELTNALALTGILVDRVMIRSVGNQVFDTLFVTDRDGGKLTDENHVRELRAAVVLIKHFTHMLPRSPNPEAALLQFRDFLEHLFQRPNWPAELSSLERPEVLRGLARLLGMSRFLWQDFLRLQHANLFPVVTDVEGLSQTRAKSELRTEIAESLQAASDTTERRKKINAFKDREMFRVDMRHILGHISEFGIFAEELSDVADVVVGAAFQMCFSSLESRYGRPVTEEGQDCRLSVCALGKCGGREMGFASDVELMFLYEQNGKTTGPEDISTAEFVLKLVEMFNQTIKTRRKGIFEIDLRLRPYGNAGSLAVSLEAFKGYFSPDGAAWPYERQALVKLRPIAGDVKFGQRIVSLRDEMVYIGKPFDVTAMRALREKQIRQLVEAGTFNAKLSPGGLVDCEYLIQGLQMTHGKNHPSLRTRSTRKAIVALHKMKAISSDQRDRLLDAYVFLRRLIDALRMVRGHARDLKVPANDTEEFQFLARRLSYGQETSQLSTNLDRHTNRVQEIAELLHPTTKTL